MVVEGDGAESCCLLSEERCEGNQKRSEVWGREGVGCSCNALPSLLPCPARPGGLSTSRGVLCGWGVPGERELHSLFSGAPCLLSLPPRAPLPECYALREKVCVDGVGTREGLGGCWREMHKKKACVEGGVPSVLPPGHTASFLAVCPSATWLILPVVICSAQRLSHACLSIRALARNCERLITTVVICTALSSSLVG